MIQMTRIEMLRKTSEKKMHTQTIHMNHYVTTEAGETKIIQARKIQARTQKPN